MLRISNLWHNFCKCVPFSFIYNILSLKFYNIIYELFLVGQHPFFSLENSCLLPNLIFAYILFYSLKN